LFEQHGKKHRETRRSKDLCHNSYRSKRKDKNIKEIIEEKNT
jgi:hypothetical protein